MLLISSASEQEGSIIDHLTPHSSHDRPGDSTLLYAKLASKYLPITKANSAAVCKETLSLAGSDKLYTVSCFVTSREIPLTLEIGHH